MEINSLYIIKRDTGVCIYHKDFTESGFDPQLLSSFLVAMTSFFDEATRSMSSQARAVEGANYKIIVEFGEGTLGAISTKEDTAHVRKKLRRMIDRFEEQFNVLRWVDIDLAVHTRFEQSVINEFIRDRISPDTIITVRAEYDKIKRQIQKRLNQSTSPVIFNSGELADSLSMEHLTRGAQEFIPWFRTSGNGYLFMLTKSDNVDEILELPHSGHTVIAWSMNNEVVSFGNLFG